MPDFTSLIRDGALSLVVSLPRNDLDLARAALDAGADAIKVHANVWHRASGNTFGSLEDNRSFLHDLITVAQGRPVGLVPGARDSFITPRELRELEDMGLSFFSAYADDCPPFMLASSLTRMLALHDTCTRADLVGLRDWDLIDVVEASIINGEEYGSPLRVTDLLRYRSIVRTTGKPVLVPTQRAIDPDDVWALRDAGCGAVMIGAVVMRGTGASCVAEATRSFRRAIDSI